MNQAYSSDEKIERKKKRRSKYTLYMYTIPKSCITIILYLYPSSSFTLVCKVVGYGGRGFLNSATICPNGNSRWICISYAGIGHRYYYFFEEEERKENQGKIRFVLAHDAWFSWCKMVGPCVLPPTSPFLLFFSQCCKAHSRNLKI